MSKELTPLENWKEVKDYLNYCLYDIAEDCKAICYTSTSGYLQPHIDNVEKALKDYETRKTFIETIDSGEMVFEPRNVWEEKQKKLKALEIIKKKSVNVWVLGNSNTFADYNYITGINLGMAKLSAKEFKLLKEVLLCEQ